MKVFKTSLSGASLVLLAVQLAVVSSIAAKYLYERWTCPRVWTRAAAYDPELTMRGRYLSMQLQVDGCKTTLPSTQDAVSSRSFVASYQSGPNGMRQRVQVAFPARLGVEDGKLVAVRIASGSGNEGGQTVSAWVDRPCDAMRLADPVNFYIAEHAANPLPVKAGQELWVEVTVPPKGTPRPIQLALKENGVWRPLAFQ
jgi:hypothetical protein